MNEAHRRVNRRLAGEARPRDAHCEPSILCALYNLSADAALSGIRDRLAFMRFWGWVFVLDAKIRRGCTANS